MPTIADTPIYSADVTWQTQDGVWNPMDRSKATELVAV